MYWVRNVQPPVGSRGNIYFKPASAISKLMNEQGWGPKAQPLCPPLSGLYQEPFTITLWCLRYRLANIFCSGNCAICPVIIPLQISENTVGADDLRRRVLLTILGTIMKVSYILPADPKNNLNFANSCSIYIWFIPLSTVVCQHGALIQGDLV